MHEKLRLSTRLVLAAVDETPDTEAEWKVRTDRAARRAVIEELLVMITAVGITAAFDVDELEEWASNPPREFVLGIARHSGTPGLNPNVKALKTAVLLHERIDVQCEITAAMAEFMAVLLTSVSESGQLPDVAPHEMLVAIDAANNLTSQLIGSPLPVGHDEPFAWATRLGDLTLGQRRALIATAALMQPTGLSTIVVAEVLDLVVGPLLDDALHTAALVDALADLGSHFKARFDPPGNPAADHALQLAQLSGTSQYQLWEYRDSVLDTPDAGEVIDLVSAQVKIAAAALLTRSRFDGVSIDELMSNVVARWLSQPPMLPGLSERQPPPPPWGGDDGLGDGLAGRALRLVDAHAFSDEERFFHFVLPMMANLENQAGLISELVELVDRTTTDLPAVVVDGVRVDLAELVSDEGSLVGMLDDPDAAVSFLPVVVALTGVVATAVRSEADRQRLSVPDVIRLLAAPPS